MGLLRELLPAATRVGLLVNPTNENVEGVTNDVVTAAATLGVQIDIVRARAAMTSARSISDLPPFLAKA